MTIITSWICLALFNVSMLSGLILAFMYKPFNAYESVQTITYLVPFGDIFRQIHYFSSQLFVAFLILHIIFELLKLKIKISQSSWNYSIMATLVLFFLMFTGYVLKADLNGLSAGQVALSLIEQTPVLEWFLPLFEDSSTFVWKFYIWHILFLPLLLGFGIYKHIDKLKTKYFIIGLGITVLTMIVFTMPKDLDINLTLVHVTGPWFFKGAENLLVKGVPTLLVDFVIAIPFILLVLYFYFEKYRKIINYLLLLWTALYAYFIFI